MRKSLDQYPRKPCPPLADLQLGDLLYLKGADLFYVFVCSSDQRAEYIRLRNYELAWHDTDFEPGSWELVITDE